VCKKEQIAVYCINQTSALSEQQSNKVIMDLRVTEINASTDAVVPDLVTLCTDSGTK
jgi:hypothetical protein